jgi:hypothetical protein
MNDNDKDWNVRKRITRNRIHNKYPVTPTRNSDSPQTWYQENWDPDFSCSQQDKIGSVGDGHKWICNPDSLKDKENCVVYSVGSNGDFSFEQALVKRLPNCDVHVFDFGDYSRETPRGIHFHGWGLKPSYHTNTSDWNTRFATQPWRDPNRPMLQFKTLQQTMTSLGHEQVDIFKIDCEGCEWQSYKDWLGVDLRQVLVEVHDSPGVVVNDFFQSIHDAGYVMFYKEPNIQFSNGRCQEISFLKMSKSFFS